MPEDRQVTLAPYYRDEAVTIYHGDSREILPLLAAQVMVTDPPYGIQHTGVGFNGARVGLSIVNDHDASVRDDVLALWGDRPALVFGSSLRPNAPGTQQVLCWDKGNAAGLLGANRGWRYSWEPVYVIGVWPKVPALRRGVIAFDADRQGAKDHGHPHTKPVPLLRSLIEACPPGTVIDPFAGSGSTLRAAKDLGRRAIGIEIDERWCQVAAERCAQEVLDVARFQ